MILCLTPNPAIDRTLYVQDIKLGEVHRIEKILTAAGGKGLNVARTIHTFGGEALCMGPVGGHSGRLLAELAKGEGLAARWTRVRNETRTCTILVEANRDATVINGGGPEMNKAECEVLMKAVWQQAAHAKVVCVSGSLPKGFSQRQFRTLLAGLVKSGKPIWVDTSGEALKTALKVRGLCIKVNTRELGEAWEREIPDARQAALTARGLCSFGIRQVALTSGKRGAILVTAAEAWKVRPPSIQVVSSVGSGDAFLGALALAIEAGFPPETALSYGAAAGSANALHFGGGEFSRREFERIRGELKIQRLSF